MEDPDRLEEKLTEEEAIEIGRGILERLRRSYRKSKDLSTVLNAIVIASGSGLPIPKWAISVQADINRDILAIRDSRGQKQRAKEAAVYKRLGLHMASSRKKDNDFELYAYGREVEKYREAHRSPTGKRRQLPSIYAELEGGWDGEHPTWSELKKGHQFYQRMKRQAAKSSR